MSCESTYLVKEVILLGSTPDFLNNIDISHMYLAPRSFSCFCLPVHEAADLPCLDPDALCDPYVKVIYLALPGLVLSSC